MLVYNFELSAYVTSAYKCDLSKSKGNNGAVQIAKDFAQIVLTIEHFFCCNLMCSVHVCVLALFVGYYLGNNTQENHTEI